MKVSLNIVRQYLDFELPPVQELVARINAQLGGVEEVIDLASKYKDAKIVKVIECEKHANADKLSVCKIDAGTGELVQVVCGANNVRANMWAVWLPPKSIVPATFGDTEPFVLGERELRGVMSNGMLASARELAIGDDHDGIVDIAKADVPPGKTLDAGASFAETFGLNDTIIDIENKMFTHRPDLFGQLGVAREIAGILGRAFTSPKWYITEPVFEAGSGELSLEVFNNAPGKVPRFMAVAIKDVEVKPSPLWLKCALVAMGGKPINNIVDVTNYVMLLTAQPTHAYDYDKVRGAKLGVRMARPGETIPLLNGKTYELTSDDIVVADGEGAVGLAGIMGGANSEVSANTKNIILEVANFDMYAVRKSSMRHGLFTDALTRFNKGQSPLQNSHVMALLLTAMHDAAGGDQASIVYDEGQVEPPLGFQVANDFVNERLGLRLRNSDIVKLLTDVEIIAIDLADHDTVVEVVPPFWRTDLELPEDIVEEVGRLYGFDKLPRDLPRRTTKPTPLNPGRQLAREVRTALARSGANEVLTYSFVHERVLKAVGQDTKDAYRLSNALSPDLQYYRLSLTPSLLDRIHANIKAGHDEFALFEIGRSHGKSAGFDNEGLPVEASAAALVYASKNPKQGAAFYRAKAHSEFLARQLGIEVAYESLAGSSTSPVVAPFEAKRSAIISDKKTGQYIGVIGEYKKVVQRNFKLPEYVAGFELDMDTLVELAQQVEAQYRPLSRYPSVERDISLKVDGDMAYEKVVGALKDALPQGGLDAAIAPLGIYQPADVATKNITFRITLTSHEKTLTNAEVNAIVDDVSGKLGSAIGAEIA